MSQDPKPFTTVSEVVSKECLGEDIKSICIYSHPFHPTVGYRAGTTLGDNLDHAKRLIPKELVDRLISWEEIEQYLHYDERIAATASFTLWTNSWILEHLWISSGETNCGGSIVKIRRISRNPTCFNPVQARFSKIADTSPH